MDETGVALDGVSILATGTTLAVARSDSRGRFALVLPVGRISAPGHARGLSVHVSRAHSGAAESPSRAPDSTDARCRVDLGCREPFSLRPPQGPDAPVDDERHGHGEMAWRLRHLSRTVLRDERQGFAIEEDIPPALDAQPATFGGAGRPRDRADGARRGLVSDGHGFHRAHQPARDERPARRVRAMHRATGRAASRTCSSRRRSDRSVIGRSEARWRPATPRRGRCSASTRRTRINATPFVLPCRTARRASRPAGDLCPLRSTCRNRGVSVASRPATDGACWPSVALDYGVRFDHYDYLSEPSLVSPHAGFGVEVVPGTVVRASTSQRMIAPGADEFLPPSESGPVAAARADVRFARAGRARCVPSASAGMPSGLDKNLGAGTPVS